MPKGICKLCQQDKPLVLSHFMPRALYGYCRSGDSSPIKVGHGVVIPTDRQTQDYLLCEVCEDVLNKGGETWLTPKLATMDRHFPFYDLLTRLPPDSVEDGAQVYFAAKNSEIEVDKIAHFAMGLFWKASVHSWTGDGQEPRIQLGPYSDSIRLWLLGDGPFAAHINLAVIVSPPLRAQITFSDPREGVKQGWRSYYSHVPGILFMMSAGKDVSPEMQWFCFHNNPGHPIAVSEDITAHIERMFAGAYNKSRKTRAFVNSRAKRARGR